MNFLQAVKVFELNVLRQSGVTITPDQVGLKSDPIADLQAKNANTTFSGLLNGLTGTTGTLTLPTPPTPPTNLDDKTALLKYQNELLAYNQSSQLYNQRMMQALLTQMQTIQKQALSARSTSGSSSDSSSVSSSTLGVGGII
jgi:hypothetical protein